MRRITSILTLMACLTLLTAVPATAGLFGDDTLVTIDGDRYSTEDFKRWWKFWQEPDQALPKTPEPYIDWLLLSQEAKRMDLQNDPGFKYQTRIFVQSRALLMLKYHAVDSQIEVTDDEIKARYNERYVPRWQVKRIVFKDEDAAMAAWEELAGGTVTLEELLARGPGEGGPVTTADTWTRPSQIDPGWAALFEKTPVGEVVDPGEHARGAVLYFLKEQVGGDEEDFARYRKSIRGNLWEEEEDALTRDLLRELRDKYEVKIDEERLAALDINAADDTFTDAAVITTSKEDVSEKQFMAVIRRLMANRPAAAHAGSDEEEARKFKVETANNIIHQSVTNWESVDRHFEKEEPFKWEYEFNYNHRLGQMLEQRLFAPEVKVTEDEISQHYKDKITLYTRPSTVELYFVDETQAPIDRIWADVAAGKGFLQVVNELPDLRVEPRQIPANHLDPEVKPVVDKLAEGETSQIFEAQGVRLLVHLADRTPEAAIPLERVKASIQSRLEAEKLGKARKDFLETLKSRTDIDVHERHWKKLRKELGGA